MADETERTLEQDIEAAYQEASEEPAEVEVKAEEKPAETQPPAEEAKTEEQPEAAAEAAPAEPLVPGEPAPEPEAEVAPLDAPAHWALDHQQMFRGLDAKAQQFLLDRSKDMEAAHTKRSQEIAPLRSAAEKWTPYLNQMQATPERVFDTLMATEYNLRTGTNEQKMNILLGLARDYGVDFTNGQAAAPSAEEDPFQVHTRIQEAVAPLTQQIQQLHQTYQQQEYGRQQTGQQAAQSSIDQFKNEAGADGKPAHPYFDEVYEDMTVLAQAKMAQGQPVDIAKLYEQACWSNPPVRAKIQAAEKHAAQLASRKADQERAAKQRTASGGLSGTGGGKMDQPKTTEDAVAAAYDQLAAAI